MSNNKNEIINKLFPKFRFIEKDISKFTEIAFINGEENLPAATKNIYIYIASIINRDGLIKIFEDAIKEIPVEEAFDIFDKVLDTVDVNLKDEDIETLSNSKKCQKYYKEAMKQVDYNTGEINIVNELLQRVIEARILFSTDIEIEDIKEEDYIHLSDDILKDYLKYIGKFEVLDREEEKALFIRYKQGDEEAYEEIINHNLKLVVAIAKVLKPENLNMGFMDYIQEGNMGLMKAVEKFDPYRGNKFSTYAYWWIKQALKRSVDDNDAMIRIPVHMNEKVRKYNMARRRLNDRYNREPTDDELIRELKWPQRDLDSVKKVLAIDIDSLDRPVNADIGDSDSTLIEFIPDKTIEPVEEKIEREILHDQEEKILDKVLTKREAHIIKHRIGFDNGEPETLEAIGKQVGVTRERVRQLEFKAYKKLEVYGKRVKEAEKIKNIINGKETDDMRLLTIYDIVHGNVNEVNRIIKEELTPEERNLINKREKKKLTAEENKQFFVIVNKIKSKLSNGQTKDKDKRLKVSIYEMIDANRKDIDKIIENELTKEEIRIIQTREERINGILNEKLDGNELKKFYRIVAKIKRKLKSKNKPRTYTKKTPVEIKPLPPTKPKTINSIFASNYRQLLSIIIKDSRVLQEIDIIDISIACVRYGIGECKQARDVEAIAKLYNITPEEVDSKATKVLEKLYNILLEDVKSKTDESNKLLIKKKEETKKE